MIVQYTNGYWINSLLEDLSKFIRRKCVQVVLKQCLNNLSWYSVALVVKYLVNLYCYRDIHSKSVLSTVPDSVPSDTDNISYVTSR